MPGQGLRPYLIAVSLIGGLLLPNIAFPAEPLGSYRVGPTAISVSGISSGGFMAQQFHVAYSKIIMGAEIIAGGPYDCAGNKPGWPPEFTATDVCSTFIQTANPFVPFLGPPEVAVSVSETRAVARKGAIDPVQGLAGDKVYLFSGTRDSLIPQSVMDTLKAYYRVFLPARSITYVNNIPAEHAMVTDDFGNRCDTFGSPFINNCGYDTAGNLLRTIYGKLNPVGDPATGKLLDFDQAEFLPPQANISMNQIGHVFVPAGCETGGGCRLHVAFHGCMQSQEAIGDAYYAHAGYNKWAASNRIIVLYPQTKASSLRPLNPNGCWDWWGYTGADFAVKSGKQMTAVRKMIDRVAQ